jgi:hypothetical protein
MKTRMKFVGLIIVAAVVLNAQGNKGVANPRPLPMTYNVETTAEGEIEVEQYVDLVPLKATSTSTGSPTWFNALAMQTELEYGITRRLELGLYFTVVPSIGENLSQASTLPHVGNGMKQRLRYRLTDPETWPVDVALYGELVETQNEIEVEAKVILQRRLGRVRLMVNISGEREFYFDGRREWVANPSGGATVELSARYHLGVETWWRAEYPDVAPAKRNFNLGPQGYVGPAFLMSFNRFWWSNGAYIRVTHANHSLAVGDSFGPVWFRSVCGVSF